jgi:hypothetical protein
MGLKKVINECMWYDARADGISEMQICVYLLNSSEVYIAEGCVMNYSTFKYALFVRKPQNQALKMKIFAILSLLVYFTNKYIFVCKAGQVTVDRKINESNWNYWYMN